MTRYQLEKAGLFINFTPVPDTCLGHTVIFNGTTNLPAVKHLTLEIYPVWQQHCQKTIYPCGNPETVNAYCCYAGFNRTVTIIPGRDGINSFSLAINTSESDFRPETYFIGTTDTFAWGEFTIIRRPDSSGPWISIDPVSHHFLGDTIQFHGTTNLAF